MRLARLCSVQDRYVAAERLSTVALVVVGSMAVAETTGVAVQSILTVGGIGGKSRLSKHGATRRKDRPLCLEQI